MYVSVGANVVHYLINAGIMDHMRHYKQRFCHSFISCLLKDMPLVRTM